MRALVTGGAGFIGSHLANRLVEQGATVVVLDDLSAGSSHNIAPSVDLIVGDVADQTIVRRAISGADLVFHQAAHRAVARSVEYPIETDHANVHGTVTVLKTALDAGVRRVIYASSSSLYGGAEVLPTPEDYPGYPRSPYAVTKLAGEHYCRVFAQLLGLETVALRYFNVYGPNQRPDSAYAAVIPLFIEALRAGRSPVVHGDGLQSRAFTFIDDVVSANLAAASAPASRCSGRPYNIAGESSYTLLEVLELLQLVLGTDIRPTHVGPRAGDIRHSSADITAAAADLAYRATVGLESGLRKTIAWFDAQ